MKLTFCWLDASQPFDQSSPRPLEGRYSVAVIDGRPDLTPWEDLNWPAIPGCFGRPWFLPILGAYYRMKELVT